MNTPAPQKKSTPPLAQKALERLVTICKGNGIDVKQIGIVKVDAQDVRFSAGTFFELAPTTEDKVLPGRQQVGELIPDPREVDRAIRDLMEKAQQNHSVEEMLARQLLARKDKGFMLEGAVLPLSGMDKQLCWHEPCQSCHHSGKVACEACHGQKFARCQQCHGRTMMQCPLCRGSGQIMGQRGQHQPCNKCNGMRRVPCTVCHRTGKIPCNKCHATGMLTCQTCKGQAYSTRIVTLGLKAQTRADYTRGLVPEHMTFLIENDGPALVADGDIAVTTQAMQEEGKMGIHYEAAFPFADITFRIGNKPVKVGAYGQGKFVRLPPVLDHLLSEPLDALTMAARGQGDVAGILKQVGRYRVIALALVTTIRANAAQTTKRILQKYPEGLSPECAMKIGKAADTAVAIVTRKPRYTGLIAGLTGVTALYALYYLGPGRGMITPHVDDPRFNMIIDAALVLLGGTMTTLSIQIAARGALHKAVGHLIPREKRASMMPRTGGAGLWGYGAGVIIYFLMIELTRHIAGGNTPLWYQSLMSMIGL